MSALRPLRIAGFACLSAAVLLAGCVTPPSEGPQGTPLDTAGLGLGADLVHPAPEPWWKVYGDPQLDRLVERTLAQNPSLAQALSRVDDANARSTAAGARRRPAVSLDGTEQRQRLSERDIIPPPYGGQWIWRGDLGVNLSWDLDFWGRQAALVQAAETRSAAAQLDIETAKLVLAGSLARSYLQLDHAYRLADLAEQTRTQRAQLADLTRRRVAAGLETGVALRDAEAVVPLARVEATQAQADIERAVHALAALTAEGPRAYPQIGRPQLALEQVPRLPAALPANLLARRPDVIAARLRVDAADAQHVAARAAFYPEINLSAFAGFGAIGLDQLLTAEARQYGIGPRLHLPIFDAQRLKAEYRQANAAIDSAVAVYNATVLYAVQQVADALTDISAAERALADQRIALEHAEAAYALAEKRYRAGLSNRLTVLRAEERVLDGRRRQIDLVDGLAQARVGVLLALGGSFDPDRFPSSLAAAPAAEVVP